MTYYIDTLSLLILLTCFMLVADKHTKAYIKTFRIQSMLIAITAGIMSFNPLYSKQRFEMIIVCVIILFLKVIYIPHLLNKTFISVTYKVEKGFYLNIPFLVLISCGLVVFAYFSISTIDILKTKSITLYLVNSLSMIFIGMLFMISRKKAIGQIVGFLVIENGLFATAMFATHGMPIIVDLGIFVDLITAVLVMGILVFRINEKFEGTATNKLNDLRG